MALLLVLNSTAVLAGERTSLRAALVTLEGTVILVENLPGEGGVEVTAVRMAAEQTPSNEIIVLLAPEAALNEIGFEIAPEDRIRVRVFPSEEGPALAHKVKNLSRGMMVRLRTLTRIPLWDGEGRWQGAPCRSGHGEGAKGGKRHRGSRPHHRR